VRRSDGATERQSDRATERQSDRATVLGRGDVLGAGGWRAFLRGTLSSFSGHARTGSSVLGLALRQPRHLHRSGVTDGRRDRARDWVHTLGSLAAPSVGVGLWRLSFREPTWAVRVHTETLRPYRSTHLAVRPEGSGGAASGGVGVEGEARHLLVERHRFCSFLCSGRSDRL
jgi:hypothetical protein